MAGIRYARAAPIVGLLIAVALFTGMSSEAFDRLKEAHFLRDVGLPAVGHLSPVVWFGIFWLVGMVLGFLALGRLIPAVERGGVEAVTRFLLGFTFVQLAAMVLFALSRSSWPAIVGLLGVFFARDITGPLYTTWLNAKISDSSVRATVFSLSGQADAIGQAGGGPVLGLVGNVWGIPTALAAGATALVPAAALYARAIRRHGGEGDIALVPAGEA
jgi:DHA3 family tetracycline resistance protein-like MFS transporter